MDKRILTAIRQRKDAQCERLSIRRMLESNGMGQWLELCTSRIAEDLLIDGEDVSMAFDDFPDIRLTSDGMMACKEILRSYVSDKVLTENFQYLCSCESLNMERNNFAKMLREEKLCTLWKTHRLFSKGKYDDKDRRLRKYIEAEIWSRSPFAWMKRNLCNAVMELYVRVKYHRVLSITKNCAENLVTEK